MPNNISITRFTETFIAKKNFTKIWKSTKFLSWETDSLRNGVQNIYEDSWTTPAQFPWGLISSSSLQEKPRHSSLRQRQNHRGGAEPIH